MEPEAFLPHCKGPRLNRFAHTGRPIQFDRLLSENGGLHSHVFQVIIDEQRYALKMVNKHTHNTTR